MASLASKKSAGRRSDLISLAVKLQAWWQGCNPDDLIPTKVPPPSPEMTAQEADTAAAMAAEVPADPTEEQPPANPWDPTRIELVERLWGEGFHTPGGAEHILDLVQPMRLDETKTLLDLGCGLGGGARTVTNKFGTWVTGIEWWKDLAMAGVEHSTKAGLVKKAAVQFQANGRLFLKTNSFAAVFSKEALFTVADKASVLQVLTDALKVDGELCFTDYVVPSAGTSRLIEEWREREPVGAHPWTVAEYSSALGKLGYDLRVAEDMTEQHCQLIRDGWRHLVQGLAPGSVTPELMRLVVREAEIWGRREALLRRGEIRHYRFYAIKRQQGCRLVEVETQPLPEAA